MKKIEKSQPPDSNMLSWPYYAVPSVAITNVMTEDILHQARGAKETIHTHVSDA